MTSVVSAGSTSLPALSTELVWLKSGKLVKPSMVGPSRFYSVHAIHNTCSIGAGNSSHICYNDGTGD